MTTTPTRIDDEIEGHVATVFPDTPVVGAHLVRVTWACGHFVIVAVEEGRVDEERSRVCRICAMDDADLDRELGRIAAHPA